MSNEQTALLSGTKGEDSGSSTTNTTTYRRSIAPTDPTARRLQRQSRFGLDGSKGVRPSKTSLSENPEWLTKAMPGAGSRASRASTAGGGGKKQRAQSFVEHVDGSISALTPLEMGRHELYEELPFIAIPGMQKKEHALSIAFSSFAAVLDNQETEEYLVATTGKGLKPWEKSERLSRMSTIMLDELEGEEGASVTLPLVFAVLVASTMAFNVGYNISVMNPAEAYAFPGHTTSMWSMAVASFAVGGPFGAVLAGKWADDKGRRGALLLTTWLFIIGGLIQTLAPTLTVVVVARTIIGVASGATTVLVPIYLGELAPPNLRGVIGTMTQFALVIGILAADLVGFPFGNETQWRYMFLLVTILGLCPVMLKPWLLESPRWLLGRDADSARARIVIKKLRGYRYDDEVETEVDHYLGASKKQSLDGDGGKGGVEESGGKSITKELFADKSVRLLLVSSLVLQVSAQLSGINAVFFYSGLFFDGVIENPLVGTTLMGAINVVACYVAMLLMDRFGRRTLIMWSSAGMFLSCVMVVLSLLGYFEKTVAIGAVASYVIFFELGLGPIPSLIVAEMFDGKYVTAAMSVCSQLNWVCTFLIGLFFPYMNKSLGPYSFGPFAVVLLLTFLYAWIILPETQGTTPAELQAALIKKNGSETYHNMDIEGTAYQAQPADSWAAALAQLEEDDGAEIA